MQCCNFSFYNLKWTDTSRKLSEMKLVQTRLRNGLCDETLDEAMRMSIEGSETLKHPHLPPTCFKLLLFSSVCDTKCSDKLRFQ